MAIWPLTDADDTSSQEPEKEAQTPPGVTREEFDRLAGTIGQLQQTLSQAVTQQPPAQAPAPPPPQEPTFRIPGDDDRLFAFEL